MIPPGAAELVDELGRRAHFPPPGTAIACAVSGGADSSALVVLATVARCDVTVHHVDHGIRPGSEAEADHVAALARRFGAAFVAHTVDVESGPNLEARARAARRAVLPADVCTGHTLDDRAETMLINLVRGAGRGGLSPLRDVRRRPLRDLRRAETRQLCEAVGLAVLDDPMNEDPNFQRVRVRHELVPLLDDIAGRDVTPVLARQGDLLGDEADFLDGLAAQLDPTDANALVSAPVVLARRALRNFVTERWELGHPPSGASIERMLDVARGHAVSTQIEGGHSIHRRDRKLRLEYPGDGGRGNVTRA